jgi:hypothetical protein
VNQAIEAICFDDRGALKRLGKTWFREVAATEAIRSGEAEPQTIGNANWCLNLLRISEALGTGGALDEDQLAVIDEVLWT